MYREGINPINAFNCSHPNLAVAYDSGCRIPNMADSSQQGNPGGSGGGDEDEATPAVAGDYFDGVYEYIKQMLMEEDDLEHRPCMFNDCSALQACENYFHDALRDSSSVCSQTVARTTLSENSSGFAQWSSFEIVTSAGDDVDGLLASPGGYFHGLGAEETGREFCCYPDQDRNGACLNCADGSITPCVRFGQGSHGKENANNCNEDSDRRKSKDRNRGGGDGDDDVQGRSTKQLASVAEEVQGLVEQFDSALLCQKMNPGFYNEPPDSYQSSGDEVDTKYKKLPEVKRGRPKGSTKKQAQQQQRRNDVKEVVDLRTLLISCAEAVSSFNHAAAGEMLMKIRQHSSSYGDANERLAHCFANALEARLAGTGSMLYTASSTRRVPASDLLKAYRTYVTACPFKRMSNIFANKTIAKHTRDADKIHIIDFGILNGFQWPCIIQGVSLRPGGPPTLKITGIDFPQPGLRPAERVEQTGQRLMRYCRRFNVPFEYNAVAKKWDEVDVDDLKLEENEAVVVNCLYRLRHVPDESAGVDSPRDAVLKLIKKIRPRVFVHGVVNATYNAPFFTTRFREALYHYSSFFDMMEATLPREDQDRLMYEREVFGSDLMNVLACEGLERVDRPESYKQWQVRNRRAGFRKVPLDREIMEEVKVKVKKGYQCDYMVEEDSEWMLQGWKGRALYGLSCWKPIDD